MNNKNFTEVNCCPFCENELEQDITRCKKCGSERIEGHISRNERRIILWSRVTLTVLSIVYYANYSPTSQNNLLSFLLFIVSIILSLTIPKLIFKFKNRGNVIWKKKTFPV
ncbi:hypothetical protein [Rouxiella sp. WC2420]|uniref:Uncharacterized protein n=1 Tax=Rouxiella sp. WC2420 TaxID=3234145 RepID=A0AB39VMK6_9GAMM